MFSWTNDNTPVRSAGVFPWEEEDEEENFLMSPPDEIVVPELPVAPGPDEPVYQRTFLDRVFAPFEAPQQFLFSATKGIAEDGFQARDIWNAFAHSGAYFNPWSDTERISETEMAEIFFGDISNDFMRGAANIGLSLLYDPLLLTGAVKLAGAGARTVSTIDKLTNPAGVVLGLAGRGLKEAAPAIGRAAAAIPGPERAESWGNQLNLLFRNPSSYNDPRFTEIIGREAVRLSELRTQFAPVAKKVHAMGGYKADEVFADLMSSTAAHDHLYANTPLSNLSRAKQDEFAEVVRKVEAAGVDKELMFEQFQQAKLVTMEIQDMMLKSGILPPAEAAALGNTHLRQMYLNLQHPTDAQRRINKLIENTSHMEDGQRVANVGSEHLYESQLVITRVGLHEELDKLARTSLDVTTEVGRNFQTPGARTAVTRRYFPNVGNTGARRFNTTNFIEDLDIYLTGNPTASVDEVMQHVRGDMLELGSYRTNPVGEDFLKAVADAVTGAQVQTRTVDDIAGMIAQAKSGSSIQFTNLRQNLDVIAKREAIPDEIMRDVMGFVDVATPRIAQQIDTAGRQASLGLMFDEISGAVRIGADEVDRAYQSVSVAANRIYQRGTPRSAMSRTRRDISGRNDALSNVYPDAPRADINEARRELDEIFSVMPRSEFLENPEYMRTVRDEAAKLMDAHPSLTPEKAESIVNGIVDGRVSANSVIDNIADSIAIPEGAPRPSNYVKLSDSSNLGSLDGMYVPPMVAAQMKNYSTIIDGLAGRTPETMRSRVGDAMSYVTNVFKFVNIVADPTAHFRDFAGSLIQMEAIGVGKFSKQRLDNAMSMVGEAKAGRIHPTLQIAHDIGYDLLGAGITGSELRRTTQSLTRTRITQESGDWLERGRDLFARATEKGRQGANSMGNVYQLREGLQRSYVFTGKYDEILDGVRAGGGTVTREVQLNAARQAAELTDRALFNYADIPLAMEFARKYGIAPFITFPVKATGQLADMLYNQPYSVLKYDRVMDGWNSTWAGGDEEFVKEINALPEHMRDAMVVRLPGNNKDGNPLYLDLSYFIPWAAVRDVGGDLQGLTQGASGVGVTDSGSVAGQVGGSQGTRSTIISPIITQLSNAISTGTDGLGRPLWDENASTDQILMGAGRFLYQFMVPPSMPGGSTADSVGRALMAAAQESPEPVDWLNYMGRSMRTAFKDDDVFNRYGEGPAARALPTVTENPFGQAGLGLASLFLPVSESDMERQLRNSASGTQAEIDSLEKSARAAANNPNIGSAARKAEIDRITDLIEAVVRDHERYENSVR